MRRFLRSIREPNLRLPISHCSTSRDRSTGRRTSNFDALVRLARILCGTSMSFISFVGHDQQWIKARIGLDLEASPRDASLCAFAMVGERTLVIPDTKKDSRSAANPFVTGAPFMRFYAGVPLRSSDGVPLGALCVADTQPRDGLTPDQLFGLETLARQVMLQLESRRRARWRQRTASAISAATAAGFVGQWDFDITPLPLTGRDTAAGTIPAVRDTAAIETVLAKIHPDDRPEVAKAIAQSLESGGDVHIEYRIGAARRGRPLVAGAGASHCATEGVNRRLVGIVVDITERKAIEESLAASEGKFRTTADTMPQMVWSTRADGYYDYYNARWYAFTGVAESSTDGEGWNAIVHPDDQEKAWTAWRRSLATGEAYEIEFRLRHRSGRYRWTLARALPVRNSRGIILRWFGTFTDINDQKIATEERELVAQELSHRIKNTFLVISGLIGLQARTDPAVRPFAESMRARILALGRAHNFIRPHSRQSRPDSVSMTAHGLFAELFAPYRLDDRSRIRITGDDVAVDDRAATPLALLFHELATNATKYGALSSVDGTVTLDTRRSGDDYIMEWAERGGPEIGARPSTNGFGTRVSQLSVEAQLGGSIERVWDRAGLRVSITIPVQSIRPREEKTAALTETT